MIYKPGHRLLLGDMRLTEGTRLRATSRGLATVGGRADPDGPISALPLREFTWSRSDFDSVESIKAYLDGCERWHVVWDSVEGALSEDARERWEIVKEAGPYKVVRNLDHTRIGICCQCGWHGKLRAMRARRMLNGDQASHRCEVRVS